MQVQLTPKHFIYTHIITITLFTLSRSSTQHEQGMVHHGHTGNNTLDKFAPHTLYTMLQVLHKADYYAHGRHIQMAMAVKVYLNLVCESPS